MVVYTWFVDRLCTIGCLNNRQHRTSPALPCPMNQYNGKTMAMWRSMGIQCGAGCDVDDNSCGQLCIINILAMYIGQSRPYKTIFIGKSLGKSLAKSLMFTSLNQPLMFMPLNQSLTFVPLTKTMPCRGVIVAYTQIIDRLYTIGNRNRIQYRILPVLPCPMNQPNERNNGKIQW